MNIQDAFTLGAIAHQSYGDAVIDAEVIEYRSDSYRYVQVHRGKPLGTWPLSENIKESDTFETEIIEIKTIVMANGRKGLFGFGPKSKKLMVDLGVQLHANL